MQSLPDVDIVDDPARDNILRGGVYSAVVADRPLEHRHDVLLDPAENFLAVRLVGVHGRVQLGLRSDVLSRLNTLPNIRFPASWP